MTEDRKGKENDLTHEACDNIMKVEGWFMLTRFEVVMAVKIHVMALGYNTVSFGRCLVPLHRNILRLFSG